MAEEQDASRVQAIIEQLDGRLAGTRVEIDEDVAAKDCVRAAQDPGPVLVE